MSTVETANKATAEAKNGVNNTEVKVTNAKAATRSAKNDKADTTTPKANGAGKKADAPKAKANTAEPTKAELKAKLAENPPVMGLDETIKILEDLHRAKVARDRLLSTIGTLEDFEVKQLDEGEIGQDSFNGCQLKIKDDKGGEFVTKNPFIIHAVVQYVKNLCFDKLAEVEGNIRLPF